MPPPVSATTSVPTVGYDFLTPILHWLFGASGLITAISVSSVIGFLAIIWGIVVVIGYLLAFIFLYLYIYASVQSAKLDEIESGRIEAVEKAYAEKHSDTHSPSRLADVREHIRSNNPNDWKLAIIEADIVLDELLKRQGYAGVSLGERLRSISPSAMASLDDAWEAHKVRNQIAHGGVDFVLTKRLAEDTITRYERVFSEFNVG